MASLGTHHKGATMPALASGVRLSDGPTGDARVAAVDAAGLAQAGR